MTATSQDSDTLEIKPPRATSNRWLSIRRMLRMAWGTLLVVPPYYLGQFRYKTEAERIAFLYRGTQAWLNAMAKAIEVEVTVIGTPPTKGSLIAPNHTTYADTCMLPTATKVWFVAKADVLRWPLFSWLFRFSRNLTVDRDDIRCLRATNQAIAQRIQDGYNVCVFLEGTTSDGNPILPFRGPLLQPALDGAVDVVPVCITWHADDPDINPAEDIAYWRNHPMLPHIVRFLGFRGMHCTIQFGEPIRAEGDRKELAETVRAAVVAMQAGIAST